MKFLSTLILLFAFMGSAAHAYQGTLHFAADGSVVVKPLAAKCSADVANLEDAPVSCDANGKTCPQGYTRTNKYCWGGWDHGFYRCGVACKKQADCANGPYANPKCVTQAAATIMAATQDMAKFKNVSARN